MNEVILIVYLREFMRLDNLVRWAGSSTEQSQLDEEVGVSVCSEIICAEDVVQAIIIDSNVVSEPGQGARISSTRAFQNSHALKACYIGLDRAHDWFKAVVILSESPHVAGAV